MIKTAPSSCTDALKSLHQDQVPNQVTFGADLGASALLGSSTISSASKSTSSSSSTVPTGVSALVSGASRAACRCTHFLSSPPLALLLDLGRCLEGGNAQSVNVSSKILPNCDRLDAQGQVLSWIYLYVQDMQGAIETTDPAQRLSEE